MGYLTENDFFIVEARFDGALLDFEDIYDNTHRLDDYNKQQIVGVVGY